eukprot:TRINITY_DN10889_c0_g2_i11.p1 TRINITY_DN10889_c0_g2~~TRINITY_DN10889_c0_g2_i11.p1  ORF type:complete len:308 (+),score=76.41 TRINITY_DN10889_c0_g2_i11:136-924(+)
MAAVAAACCYKAANLFVTAPQVRPLANSQHSEAVSFRGTVDATSKVSSASSLPAAAAVVVGAGALASRARGEKIARRSAAAPAVPASEAAEAPEEKKAPPPFDPTDQVGVTAPLGYFDPLGFCPPGDEENWRRLRAAEVKHGRVAMLACAGSIIQHWVRIPGLGFEDAEPGITALWKDPTVYPSLILILACGVIEALIWTEPTDWRRQPGDFEDPLGLGVFDEETFNRELNNGRLAMFTSLGIIANELVTGNDAIEQLGIPF